MLFKNEVLLPGNEMLLPVEGATALALIAASLKTSKYIGVVQTKEEGGFYSTGTLGRVLDYEEIEPDKICLFVEGIKCFDILSFKTEYALIRGEVRYTNATTPHQEFSREKLKKALAHYFLKLNMQPNWEVIHNYSDKKLMQYLLNFCPFQSIEKQCLLEAKSLHEQCFLLTQLVELSFPRCRFEGAMN
ncbi:MAG: LON peptidase substrate-binding domain-containing protein [Alphaproteobacteria bacterium]|nr:MAG: LON peptidase substrate-binding domain-containing protein [Alphaproteobacteria bacterium]